VIATLLLIAVGGVLVTVSAATGRTDRSASGQMVDVGGHRLYIECTGSGSPTVVLQQQGAADRTIELLERLILNEPIASRLDEPHKLQMEQKETKITKTKSRVSLRFLRSLLFKSLVSTRLSRHPLS
jgi:hypothetical protein